MEKNRNIFKCNRCGTVYTVIKGDVVGCCVAPVTHRISRICGGELIEQTLEKPNYAKKRI